MNTHKPAERHTGRGFLLVFALLGAGASVGLVWRQQRVQFYRERAEAGSEVQRMATVVRKLLPRPVAEKHSEVE